MRNLRRTLAAGTVLVAALALASCSSSSSSDGGSASAGGSSGVSAEASLAAAHKGLAGALPSEAVKPGSDVNFWVASCGQQIESCSSIANGAVAAAKELGWTTHLCDGRLNPAGVSACVRQAVAAKADVVDVIGFDCAPIRQALVEANTAGVKTVGSGGFDCSETGGPRTYSGYIKYVSAMTNHEWWSTLGKLQADWIIGATGGKAKVLSLKFTDEAWGDDIQRGFEKELATCSGCSVLKTLEVGNADVVNGSLRTKFSTALLQASTANAVNAPVDGWFPAGLAQAISSSGRAKDLSVIGGIGQTPNMGYIRDGAGQNASAAFSGEQSAWAGVDVAIRLLADQRAPADGFPEGIGIQVVDKSTNLPSTKGVPYQPPVDFKAGYRKIWGLG